MSKAMMRQELELVLKCREIILRAHPTHLAATHLFDLVEPEFIKLLYATNQDLADIAYQKIRDTLYYHLDPKGSDSQQIDNLLLQLIESREQYLETPYDNFLAYWGQQGWTGVNLALLCLPLLLGAAFPPLGLTFLLYLGITSASAAFDFTRTSKNYWDEEQPEHTRELSDAQIEQLEQSYDNIEVYLPRNNPVQKKPIDQQLNTASYITYTLVFVISLIGLAAFLFPPIGIPAVALLALSVIAIAGTAAQLGFLHQKQRQQQAEIKNEREMLSHFNTPIEGKEHASTFVITHTLPENKSPQIAKKHKKKGETKPALASGNNKTKTIQFKPIPTSQKTAEEQEAQEREGEGEHGPHK